jgi:endosialidase-like protein
MGSRTANLQALRPVEFRLKSDPHGAVQYGLIAEEVAKVYPELVIRDRTGRIDGVRYDELSPMLLNEMQEQQRVMAAQSAMIAAQDQRAAVQDTKVAQLQEQLAGIQAALVKLQSTDQLVARR